MSGTSYYYFDDEEGSRASSETASSAQREWNHQLCDRAKQRVRDVDPNYGRCILENWPEHTAVEFVHCMPRSVAKDPELVSMRILASHRPACLFPF